MTTKLAERKVLVKDLDGHWYAIPASFEEDFVIMREAIQLAEWGTDSWYEANDQLSDTFGQYMKSDL
jgi:hypothetical protein